MIESARRKANRIKRDVAVMVVIGNPPHVENTKGRAPWVEDRRKFPIAPGGHVERPSLDEFRSAGGSRYESDLYGLPWCFWRWAIWKAFEAHPSEPEGIVAFVTPSSFVKGKSFEGMREYLRRTCDEGWIIELSPEGNRPPQGTRLFGAEVGRQLCIAVFARYGVGDSATPAVVHRLALSGQHDEKLNQLQRLQLSNAAWEKCRSGWAAPFLSTGDTSWERYPSLKDLFPDSSRGVTTGRTWVYSPDSSTLERRWATFIRARRSVRQLLLPESKEWKLDAAVEPLPGFPPAEVTLADEAGEMPSPVQVAYRSFDRQWLIPDSRLMVRPRPPLWAVRSPDQIYMTEQNSHAISDGPGVTFSHLIPDIDHYNGRSGRVFPLYCSGSSAMPNISPGLSEFLASVYGGNLTPADLFAYVAGLVAHTGYTRQFAKQLEAPGIRVPLTADPALWAEAVALGYDVLWLHTFGQNNDGPNGTRPRFRDFVEANGPKLVSEISGTPGMLPRTIGYDSASNTLLVDAGRVYPVSEAVWQYNVGNLRVIRHWFNYRSADQRHRKRSSELDNDMMQSWSPDIVTELLEIVTVLQQLVELEPRQSKLLEHIRLAPQIFVGDLANARILPVLASGKLAKAGRPTPPTLFDL